MTAILLTGATGFIGSALCRALVQKGHAVRTPLRPGTSPPAGAEQVAITDLAAEFDWEPSLRGIEVVLHTAGRAHVLREGSGDPLALFRAINRDATVRLAEAASRAGVRRFIFLSSIGVLGESTDVGHPFDETSPAAPRVPYARSKWEAEEELKRIAARSGMEMVVVRPPLVHGPGAPGNFGRLLRLVSSGVPLPFAGIENRRTFVGRSNLVDFLIACLDAADAPRAPLLPTDLESLSTADLIATLAAGLGQEARLFRLPGIEYLGQVGGPFRALGKLTGSLEVDGETSWGRVGRRPSMTLRNGLFEMTSHRGRSEESRPFPQIPRSGSAAP